MTEDKKAVDEAYKKWFAEQQEINQNKIAEDNKLFIAQKKERLAADAVTYAKK